MRLRSTIAVLVATLTASLTAVDHARSAPEPQRGMIERRAPVRRIALQPLGRVAPQWLALVRAAIADEFGVAVEILPERPLPRAALAPSRLRYRAAELLWDLDDHTDASFDNVIGITASDISTESDASPEWGVIGLASPNDRPAIVSTYRLARAGVSRALARERLSKVVRHEFAHALGLPHCAAPHCLMNDAHGKAATIDGEHAFCATCRARLNAAM